ncbi:MAG: hypothetical protein JKX72_01040 [Robiginitomaculum sp.]|nr:hypothetical protein [Robiginitomaculum sp.]
MKTHRFIENFLLLGDHLSVIARNFSLTKTPLEIIKFDRVEIASNGWHSYPELCRLAQVAPLSMSQQDFLARCKVLHEITKNISTGLLKKLLECAGADKKDISQLASLKLLERLLNIFQSLSKHDEDISAFENCISQIDWKVKNDGMNFLYNLNELRKLDAHITGGDPLAILQSLGFDRAQTNDGYGLAFDYVFDGIIEEISGISESISNVI